MNYKIEIMNTENLSIVRIYFRFGQSVTGQGFSRKIWSHNLSDYLLKKAKLSAINQAIILLQKKDI